MKTVDDITYQGIVEAVPILQGESSEFMRSFLKKEQAASFLEIGTAIAHTAVLAASIHPSMRVVTIEKDSEMSRRAAINIEASGYSDQITLIEGDALQTPLPDGSFDVIFIDAAKGQYRRFFERYAPLLSDQGCILVDNLNFHGLVEHPERTHNRHTKGLIRRLKAFRTFLEENPDFDTEFLEIGDGIAVSRRKLQRQQEP